MGVVLGNTHHANMSVKYRPPYNPLLYIEKWGLQRFTLLSCIVHKLKYTCAKKNTRDSLKPLWLNYGITENLDCGYSLEPSGWGGSKVYPVTINVLSKNKKNIPFFHRKITIFTAMKYRSILHGLVCIIMYMYILLSVQRIA